MLHANMPRPMEHDELPQGTDEGKVREESEANASDQSQMFGASGTRMMMGDTNRILSHVVITHSSK